MNLKFRLRPIELLTSALATKSRWWCMWKLGSTLWYCARKSCLPSKHLLLAWLRVEPLRLRLEARVAASALGSRVVQPGQRWLVAELGAQVVEVLGKRAALVGLAGWSFIALLRFVLVVAKPAAAQLVVATKQATFQATFSCCHCRIACPATTQMNSCQCRRSQKGLHRRKAPGHFDHRRCLVMQMRFPPFLQFKFNY